jgi:hypothetical protein|tara:strand:- start:150 stop:314 length:165 start_codon:yes stop_codon:yes gene_type:complete
MDLENTKTCEYCTREIVNSIPEDSGTGKCGGMGCGHREVYGLYTEDCHQVIVEL